MLGDPINYNDPEGLAERPATHDSGGGFSLPPAFTVNSGVTFTVLDDASDSELLDLALTIGSFIPGPTGVVASLPEVAGDFQQGNYLLGAVNLACSVGGPAGKAAKAVFRSRRLQRTFRAALQAINGVDGVGQHAHYIFPFAFADRFASIGIDVWSPHHEVFQDAAQHLRGRC